METKNHNEKARRRSGFFDNSPSSGSSPEPVLVRLIGPERETKIVTEWMLRNLAGIIQSGEGRPERDSPNWRFYLIVPTHPSIFGKVESEVNENASSQNGAA